MSAWPSDSARPASAVRVGELLTDKTVMLAKAGASKEQVIDELVARLCAEIGLSDPRLVVARILEREKGISTTLDTGLSLPHARLTGLKAIAAGLAVLPAPIPDDGGAPIRLVFLFFSPDRQEFFAAHLQLLRAVSTLLQPALIDKLCAARAPADALALLRAAEAAKA